MLRKTIVSLVTVLSLSFSVSARPHTGSAESDQLAFQIADGQNEDGRIGTKSSWKTSPKFPNHLVLPLNDGNFIVSPAFGVGTALYGKNVSEDVVRALDVGWRHIDNAAGYGNELTVGEGLTSSSVARDELYITTKFDAMGGSQDVEKELRQSLKDLQLDYVDLYLLHFPQVIFDGKFEFIWRQMEHVKKIGLTKSIGVSNFNVSDLKPLLKIAKIPPAVNQIRYHIYNAADQKAAIEYGKKYGIVTESYSALKPLTQLSGGPADEVQEKIAERLEKTIDDDEVEVTTGQAILTYIRTLDIVSVTTSSKDWRLKEQLDVFSKDWPELTKKEVKEYEKAGKKGWKA